MASRDLSIGWLFQVLCRKNPTERGINQKKIQSKADRGKNKEYVAKKKLLLKNRLG